jgi:hypothetical protein
MLNLRLGLTAISDVSLLRDGQSLVDNALYSTEYSNQNIQGVLTFVGRFTELRFTATGAPRAAMRIRILPMNQYACWPITFGMK